MRWSRRSKLSDAELQAKTPEFKQRLAAGESLDKILPEAFAVCREASRRVLGMRHYDVQLIGGMVLHLGKIAEMRTGEGKTLVATLPVYLNALQGEGVHVVTVNDYLARRDAAQMGKLYNWLGLSVGVVYPGMPHSDKREAYGSDITYGTNNEFGFDYLRDNMALSRADRYQRTLHYAIADEVDSILIDEARTPLIISGPADESPELYIRVNRIVPQLTKQESEEGEGDFWVDEKGKQVHLSEAGMGHAEELLLQAGILEKRRRRPVCRAEPERGASPQRGAACACDLSARCGLHRARWRSGDRGRIHRPYAVRAALVRRSASGGRSEGRRAGAARKTRRWPASPSRTCSACTRSCPA